MCKISIVSVNSVSVQKLSFYEREGVWRNGGLAPVTLDSMTTKLRAAVSFTPLSLYHRNKNPRYALNLRLGGSPIQAECFGEEKIPWLLAGIEL